MVINQVLRKILPRPLSQSVNDWLFAMMPRVSSHMLHNWFVRILINLCVLLIFIFIQVWFLIGILAVFWQSSSAPKNTPRTFIVRVAIQLHAPLPAGSSNSLQSDYVSNVDHMGQAHRFVAKELARDESLSILEIFLRICPICLLNFLVKIRSSLLVYCRIDESNLTSWFYVLYARRSSIEDHSIDKVKVGCA